MNPSRQSSRQARVWPLLFMGCLAGTGLASAVVGAQQNSVHPQPRAEASAESSDGHRQPESTSAATRGNLAESPRRILGGQLRGAARAADDGLRAERRSLRELAVDEFDLRPEGREQRWRVRGARRLCRR